MALLDTKLNGTTNLLRVLCYGSAHSKKTWWAGTAAEAGFNVLFLEGDGNWSILQNINKKDHDRINVIDFSDKQKEAVFAKALVRLLKQGKLIWDEATKTATALKPFPESAVCIDLTKLTQNDVVVVDSWTALVYSLSVQYSRENGIDMSDPDKADRDYYGWAGKLALWVLNQLKTLPCHVVVIAHSTVYEKYSKDGKNMEMQRRQPLSTSGPNAMQMASKFTDVLFFYAKGVAFKIDVSGDADKDGGSRSLAPKTYSWDELQFKDLCKAAKVTMPVDNPILDMSQESEAAPAVEEKKQPALGVVKNNEASVSVQKPVELKTPQTEALATKSFTLGAKK